MNGKEKMTFETAAEKLMTELFPEKYAPRNVPPEMDEAWIILDNKVKRVAIVQKRSADMIWEDIVQKVIGTKDVARFVSGCHLHIGRARKKLGLEKSECQ